MPKNPDKPLARKAARLMPQPTLRLVYTDYRKFRKMKVATIEKYESVIDLCFPDWWERNLNIISKDEILERHLSISTKNGPRGVGSTQANYAFRILRALFKYAQGRYEDVNLEPVVRRNPVNVLSSTRALNNCKRRTRDDTFILATPNKRTPSLSQTSANATTNQFENSGVHWHIHNLHRIYAKVTLK